MNNAEPSTQPMNTSPPLSFEHIAELEHKLKTAVAIALDKAESALDKAEGLLRDDESVLSELVSTKTEVTQPEFKIPAEDPGHSPIPDVPVTSVSKTNVSKTNVSKTNISKKGARQFQVVWAPFRSQTSAKGFADKLSLQLEKEFEVVRTGPGHYEVGFDFDNQPERVQVLEAINTMTGFMSEQPARERLI